MVNALDCKSYNGGSSLPPAYKSNILVLYFAIYFYFISYILYIYIFMGGWLSGLRHLF